MKALSVKNPYANLIRLGLKKFETRSRYTYHRGDVLICASKRSIDIADIFDPYGALVNIELRPSFYANPGMAICVATITDVEHFGFQFEDKAFVEFDPQKPLYAYRLENIRPIEPFKVKGNLGFFEVDDSLIKFI
jgi:activating signal cointegrator 1